MMFTNKQIKITLFTGKRVLPEKVVRTSNAWREVELRHAQCAKIT
jgi:hypothetical protein